MNGYFTAPTDVNDNTAVGGASLARNTTGSYNTAFGEGALNANTSGGENTATGFQALANNTGGSTNTAVGYEALIGNTTGGSNIAIGFDAAQNVSGGNNNNIHIGNLGTPGDNGVIKIGAQGTQTLFFAAGIRGITTGANNAVNVVVDSNGQLGTISSSRRFKEDIQDMGDASSGLMRSAAGHIPLQAALSGWIEAHRLRTDRRRSRRGLSRPGGERSGRANRNRPVSEIGADAAERIAEAGGAESRARRAAGGSGGDDGGE